MALRLMVLNGFPLSLAHCIVLCSEERKTLCQHFVLSSIFAVRIINWREPWLEWLGFAAAEIGHCVTAIGCVLFNLSGPSGRPEFEAGAHEHKPMICFFVFLDFSFVLLANGKLELMCLIVRRQHFSLRSRNVAIRGSFHGFNCIRKRTNRMAYCMRMNDYFRVYVLKWFDSCFCTRKTAFDVTISYFSVQCVYQVVIWHSLGRRSAPNRNANSFRSIKYYYLTGMNSVLIMQ